MEDIIFKVSFMLCLLGVSGMIIAIIILTFKI